MEMQTISNKYFTLSVAKCYHTTQNRIFSHLKVRQTTLYNVAGFLLGNSPASQFYVPTFRNTLSVPPSQAGRYEEFIIPTRLWRWDRVFRNVGTYNSDARQLPRRKHTTCRTQQKFEIKKNSIQIII
jgi:hypothetical protein